jgi:aryl-alcohol dehydrogenase-like predicted oxidoreductase
MGDWPNESRLSALHIRRACEDSLRRLQTDHIDLYQMHHVWREAPWEEIWQAMELLVQQGKVIYVGSSNFAGWHIAQANEAAKARHLLGLVSEQSLYNLNARTVELDLIPACESYGLGLIPWSPLAGGLLGGALQKASEGRRAGEGMQKTVENNRAKLEAWEGLCRELGEQPADVALAWLLHNKVVTAPIIGPRTMEQLEGSLRALEIQLDPDTLKKLDGIFPGYRPAPEGYAWLRTGPAGSPVAAAAGLLMAAVQAEAERLAERLGGTIEHADLFVGDSQLAERQRIGRIDPQGIFQCDDRFFVTSQLLVGHAEAEKGLKIGCHIGQGMDHGVDHRASPPMRSSGGALARRLRGALPPSSSMRDRGPTRPRCVNVVIGETPTLPWPAAAEWVGRAATTDQPTSQPDQTTSFGSVISRTA